MKKRDIFLDFTSLLDVVLIILFFFILFSYLEIEENKAAVEVKMSEANIMIQEANAKMKEANDLIDQLESELDVVRQSDERSALNLEAMIDFSRGDNVKLILQMKENGWILNVYSFDYIVTKIESDNDLEESIIEALYLAGYDANDTLFCDFVLDGDEPGTASAYRMINKALASLKNTFKYFYYSETDISIVEDSYE